MGVRDLHEDGGSPCKSPPAHRTLMSGGGQKPYLKTYEQQTVTHLGQQGRTLVSLMLKVPKPQDALLKKAECRIAVSE